MKRQVNMHRGGRGLDEAEGEVGTIREGSVGNPERATLRFAVLRSSRFTRYKVRPLTVLLATRWRYVSFQRV